MATYDEAAAARAGAAIRHPGMGKGWTLRWLSWQGGGGLFCINPHTGSDYLFTPEESETARDDWEIA